MIMDSNLCHRVQDWQADIKPTIVNTISGSDGKKKTESAEASSTSMSQPVAARVNKEEDWTKELKTWFIDAASKFDVLTTMA